tara:strand:+ start:5292 stop:5534 length:243 start_codon:yes stop_codon:yes gene_type:complete
VNLTNREKQLVTLAYYQGSCDNAKVSARHEMFAVLDQAAIESATRVLEELGLEYPNTQDIEAFWKEMDEITLYLCKEGQR